MNWKYFEPKFEYEEKFQDTDWPWAGHKFFAYDLVSNLKPKKIVELGTHYGTSFWSFVQAVKDQNIGTELNAVDSWEGEGHAGFYGEEVFETVTTIRDKFYSDLKINLIRKNFDDAVSEFEDNSIDILHIDGLHTYEAVKHDFEVWLPKVAGNGIVLFHDIKVSEADFGVYKFWDELKKQYLNIEFHHSFGLGILFMDKNTKNELMQKQDELQRHYYYLHEMKKIQVIRLQDQEIMQKTSEIENISKNIHLKDQRLQQKEQEVANLNQTVQQKEQEVANLNQTVQQKDQELIFVKSSKFWKLREFNFKIKFLLFNPIKAILKHKQKFYFIVLHPLRFIRKYLRKNSGNKREILKDSKTKSDIITYEEKIEINIFNQQQKEFSRLEMKTQIEEFSKKPLISVIMPVYNTPSKWLELAIESLRTQVYENWELCAVDDCSPDEKAREILKKYAKLDSRVKFNFSEKNGGISSASNISLRMANGEYIALLDHDDELTPDALFWVVKEINDNPDVDFIYSDECKIDDTEKGNLSQFLFKPDWSPEMLLNCMHTGHLTVYKKSLVDNLGGFRSEYDFSQDYDLALRASEKAKNIRHIERVIYLWRAIDGSAAKGGKDFARVSNLSALGEAALRRNINARIIAMPHVNYLSIIVKDREKVSIIIPSDSYENIKRSINNILSTTMYDNYEIIVVCKSALAKKIEKEYFYANNILFSYYDKIFNFSDKCNQGAKDSSGDMLVFYNDDVIPLEDLWLDKLIEYLYLPGVGGVSPKLIYEDGSIQYAGMISGVPGLIGTAYNGYGKDEVDDFLAMHRFVRSVSVLSGACCAMKKNIFDSIGGYDSVNTPNGHSDVDLSYRILESGLRCVYTPYAVLTHIGNHTWHAKEGQIDKSDIFLLKKWGKYLHSDPYFTDSMKKVIYKDFTYNFKIFAKTLDSQIVYTGKDILLVSQELDMTDASRALLNGAKELKDAGHFPVVIASQDGPMRKEFEAECIAVIVDEMLYRKHWLTERFMKNFDLILINTDVGFYCIINIPIIYSDSDLSFWFLERGYNLACAPSVALRYIGHLSLNKTEKKREILNDSSDINSLKVWGDFLIYDPFFTENMRDYLLHGDGSVFNLISNRQDEKSFEAKNLLLITHDLSLSGAPILLYSLAKFLKNNGFFVTILSPSSGPLVDYYRKEKISIVIDSAVVGSNSYNEFDKFVVNYDLVIVNTVVMGHLISRIKKQNVPIIWFIHESSAGLEYINSNKGIIDEFKNVNDIVFACKETAAIYKDFINTRVHIIPNGIEYVDLTNEKKIINNCSSVLEIIHAGSIEPRKGQDVLIDSLKYIPKDFHKKFKITFVGRILNKKYWSNVQQKAKQYKNIQFSDQVPLNKLNLMIKDSDIFVCSSRDEVFPLTILAAMSYSKPVIATNVGGINNIIKNNENGFLVESEDAEAIAKSILFFIDNVEFVKKYGENARKNFCDNFTMEKIGNNVISVINNSIQETEF